MRARAKNAPRLAELVGIVWPEHSVEELTNTASLRFHLSVGFRDENRIICFKKRL